MSASAPAEHRWARSRLAASRLGLLSDAEAARLRTHLEACAACREAAEPFEEEPGAAAGGHLSATLLARWDRARHELRGLERAMARRHLERCAECREDLAALGFSGEAGTVPEADGVAGDDTTDLLVAAAAPARTPRRLVLRPSAAPWRWRGRLLAGWATLATAAALLLLVPVRHRSVSLLPPPAPPVGEVPAAAAPPIALSLEVAGPAHALRAATRGEESGAQALAVGDSAIVVALAVPAVLAPAGSEASLELLDAGGRTLARATCPLARLQPHGRVLLRAGGAPVPPGRYVLRVTTAPDGGSALGEPEVREFRFEIGR